MTPEEQTTEAQQVLDQLLDEGLLPFKLTAYQTQGNGLGEYRLHFSDSRIHSCLFLWKEGEPFKAAFRDAVLNRVNRMSGRLV